MLASFEDMQAATGPGETVLTGRVVDQAQLHGLLELAEQTFHLPVRIAEPKGLADLPEQVAQPEYATVVGLVVYGAKARRSAPQRGGNFVSKLKSMFAGAS